MLQGRKPNLGAQTFSTCRSARFSTHACDRDARAGVSQSPASFAASSHRQLRDISHTKSLFLLVSLCLRIAVRVCCMLIGDLVTGHWRGPELFTGFQEQAGQRGRKPIWLRRSGRITFRGAPSLGRPARKEPAGTSWSARSPPTARPSSKAPWAPKRTIPPAE